MSHTPEHAQGHSRERAASTEHAEVASGGNSLGLSLVLFLVLFAAFVGGLYLMSLVTPLLFIVGLAIVLVSLFGTFTVVPALLT